MAATIETGFGSRWKSGSSRLIRPDGSFNVRRKSRRFLHTFSFYHTLLDLSWPAFLGVVAAAYLIVNMVFALVYLGIGTEHLNGIRPEDGLGAFWEAFFFSTQAFTTVGYGRVNPTGFSANIVAATEAMVGLLMFALATGLMYGRFSRPAANILFSDHAVIAPYQDVNAFMFRCVHRLDHSMVNAEVRMLLSIQRTAGSDQRMYLPLEAEQATIVMFPMNWTVVHAIREGSPMAGLHAEDLKARNAEILVMVKAFDEYFGQEVFARASYPSDTVRWGARYMPMMETTETGVEIDLSRLSDTELVPLHHSGYQIVSNSGKNTV